MGRAAWMLLCLLPGLLGAMAQAPGGRPGNSVELRRDTKVELRLKEPVSSADAHKGDVVRLELVSDLVVDGQVLARAGDECTSKITKVRRKDAKHFGVLRFSDATLRLADGKTVRLSQYTSQIRANARGEVAMITALGILFAPLVVLNSPVALVKCGFNRCPYEDREGPPREQSYAVGQILRLCTRDSVRVFLQNEDTASPATAMAQ